MRRYVLGDVNCVFFFPSFSSRFKSQGTSCVRGTVPSVCQTIIASKVWLKFAWHLSAPFFCLTVSTHSNYRQNYSISSICWNIEKHLARVSVQCCKNLLVIFVTFEYIENPDDVFHQRMWRNKYPKSLVYHVWLKTHHTQFTSIFYLCSNWRRCRFGGRFLSSTLGACHRLNRAYLYETTTHRVSWRTRRIQTVAFFNLFWKNKESLSKSPASPRKKKLSDWVDFCPRAFFLKELEMRTPHRELLFSAREKVFLWQNIFLFAICVWLWGLFFCVCAWEMWSQMRNVNETESLHAVLPDSSETGACMYLCPQPSSGLFGSECIFTGR